MTIARTGPYRLARAALTTAERPVAILERARSGPLLRRRLVCKDRVPSCEEAAFRDAGHDCGKDEPTEFRSEGEHEDGGRKDRGGDQERGLPSAAVGIDAQGDRADHHRRPLGTEDESNRPGTDADLRVVRRDEDHQVSEPHPARRVRVDDPADFPGDLRESETVPLWDDGLG